MIDFPSELEQKMRANQPVYESRGLLTFDDRIYPLGTDTKVLSTVFELLIRPFIFEIARDHGLQVHETPQQNFYPDFTLMRDEEDEERIAVDIKSTYRRFLSGGSWNASFTLGGYTSFLRNSTKNIAFPFETYAKHYIVGFIYTRTDVSAEHFYSINARGAITCPYTDVEWFIQEKYRIAGTRPGSGNTTNIGSITASSIEEFAAGNGPFAELGEDAFLDYWRNYGRTSETRSYRNLAEYLEWKQRSI